MSSGKLRTFTRGKATSLPQQSAAPQPEAWHVDAPQPKAATKRFGGFSLPGRSASNGASKNGSSANGSSGSGTVPLPRGATPPSDGASLSSVVDTAAANSANGSGPAEPEKPAVRLRRLAGVASWALALVLAGAATAIVGLFRIFGESPAWFTPAFITCGVVGMLLAMMAFATVRFRGVPWMFMAASTITLLAAFMMLRVAA
jgi:hypothetical protein